MRSIFQVLFVSKWTRKIFPGYTNHHMITNSLLAYHPPQMILLIVFENNMVYSHLEFKK